MSLLKYVPVIGRGSYEPTFKAEFRDGKKGLEGIVKMAISAEPGEYLLGRIEANTPLAGVEVTMQVSEDGNYKLNASLEKQKYDAVLRLKPAPLENAGFNVVDKNGLFALIRSPRLQGNVTYSAIPTDAATLNYKANANGLQLRNVEDSITELVKALGIIVNSLGRQQGTLYLASSDDTISRVITEAERLDSSFRRKLQS